MLTDSDFLDLWESGSRRHPLDRALLVLAAANPDISYPQLAEWPLGRRNRALAELHCRQFGNRLAGFFPCPACGEKLEVDFDAELLVKESRPAAEGIATVQVGGHHFRLPATRDLAAIVGECDADLAIQRLIAGCCVEATDGFVATAPELEAIEARLAEADPLAEIAVQLRCPQCGRESEEPIDLVQFVWAEVKARSRRVLAEVHALATAFGWTEREILGLSAARRAMYLEMLSP